MKFELDEKQLAKYKAWLEEQNAKGVEKQRREIKNPGYEYQVCWDMGYPYTGAVGGEITFCFTPNSIGEVVVATNLVTGEEIDLTDFESW